MKKPTWPEFVGTEIALLLLAWVLLWPSLGIHGVILVNLGLSFINMVGCVVCLETGWYPWRDK